VATREALDEAGVTGTVARTALGHFHYVKRQKDGARQPCRVVVFALKVESQAARWLEKSERTTRWCAAAAAVQAVGEPELKALIRRFAKAAQARPKGRNRPPPGR
jgi:hypothetical protein